MLFNVEDYGILGSSGVCTHILFIQISVWALACTPTFSHVYSGGRDLSVSPNPDKGIRRFDANLRLFPLFLDNDVCPLTIKNYNCTDLPSGGVVYTGNETKLGMSRSIAEPKLTVMDAMIDKLTGAIFIFQIVVVVGLGIAGNIWKATEARKHWYVLYPDAGPWYELLIIPLRFEILCSIMIPISIKRPGGIIALLDEAWYK